MPCGGSWLKSRPGGAERQIEVGDDGVEVDVARDRPGDVVRDRRSADAALGADHRERAADRLGVGRVEQAGDRADDVDRSDRGDQVVADAAADHFAVEHDVVEVADHQHARAGVAHLGERIEPVEQLFAAAFVLDDDDVRRRGGPIGLDRRRDAAHLHLQMRLGHAAVFAGRLHRGRRVGGGAERLDRDARHRRDVLVLHGRFGGRGACIAAFECELDHWPTSLILPLLASGYWVAVGSPLRYFSSAVARREVSTGVSARGWTRSAGLSTCAARLRWYGAAVIPVRPVRDVGAIEGRAEILRPQAARAGLGQHLRDS